MKTKQLTTALLSLVAAALMAQTAAKPATVRIKTVEVVNGVEKTTDTTYNTTDPSAISIPGGNVQVQEMKGEDGKVYKRISIDRGGKPLEISSEIGNIVISSDGQVIQLDGDSGKVEELLGKMIILDQPVKCSMSGRELKNAKEVRVTVIRKVNMSDASAEDMRQLGKPGVNDGKLSVEKMEFYPNPNNGHFNLSFTLPDHGDTEVRVLDIKGQTVFSENLPGFSGSYNKEIDISKNPKGVYFIRVEQGSHALVKKVVVD